MASTLILGGNRLALTMAKLLSSVGQKVTLIGVNQSGKLLFERIIRDEVEKDIPFQFIDDLRHQQAAVQQRLNYVQFCNKSTDSDSHIKAVIATEKDSLEMINFHGSVPVATLTTDGEWPNHITVRLYEPVEQTKMAQVIVKRETDPAALFSIRNLLKIMGIDEITREQADRADRMLHETSKPSLEEVIQAILPSRANAHPSDLTSLLMH